MTAAEITVERPAEETAGRPGRDRMVREARSRFVARGYSDVSMQEIADAVGVTKAALYYHFADKEALFGEAFVGEVERICRGVAAVLVDDQPLLLQLEAIARFLLDTSGVEFARMVADLDRHVAIANRRALIERSPRLRDVLRPIFERAKATGEIREVDLEVTMSLFFSMVFGLMRNVAFGMPSPATNEELAAAIASLVMRGIGP